MELKRITHDPAVMGGKACIRGMRVSVGMVVGLVATGHTTEEILELYPYLEADDIRESLLCAAWRLQSSSPSIALRFTGGGGCGSP